MKWYWVAAYLLAVEIYKSVQMSTPTSTNYVASVVEYPSQLKNVTRLTLRKNTFDYIEYIKQASEQGADIIVFPENGLTGISLPSRKEMDAWTTIIPAASDNYIPCVQDTIPVSDVLKNISCAAKSYTIYVVINIAEKLPCNGTDCPEDNVYYYNSNVVFDRSGKIIARYRKTNLFHESQFSVTPHPEIVTFDTDFGVKFGTFTCFDILFYQPALNLTRDLQVTDIVFPTAWFSEVPFLTAVQTQAGWSYAEDVNLLASGYNRPNSGNAGSGIYLGRNGVGKAVVPMHIHGELLVFRVPKKQKRAALQAEQRDRSHDSEEKEHSHIHDELRKKREMPEDGLFLLYDNMTVFKSEVFNDSITKTALCHNTFCCDFKIELDIIDPEITYRMVAFSGVRSFGGVINGGVSACAIIQCANNSIAKCGYPKDTKTTFNTIEITSKFEDYRNRLIMPNTLNTALLPLSNWTYDSNPHDNHVHVTMSLKIPEKNIVTFGVYSRDFLNDHIVSAARNNIAYVTSILMSLLILKSLY